MKVRYLLWRPVASTLKRSRRVPTRRAHEGKGVPGRLFEGMGTGGHDLNVGGVKEEVEAYKGDRGVLLCWVKCST